MTRFQSICLKIAGVLCTLCCLTSISMYLETHEAAMMMGVAGAAQIIYCIKKYGK